MKRKRKDPFPYDQWQVGSFSPEQKELLLKTKGRLPDKVWINSRYEVWMHERFIRHDGWPAMHWLSIKRRDKEPIRDWRDMQRIKNDLVGDEHEGVELYPAESRLVDTSNQYHMYVMSDPRPRFPFGYVERAVVEGHDDGSKQRAFEQKPDDAMTSEEVDRKLAESEKSDESAEYKPVRCGHCGRTVTPERGPPTTSLSPKAVYHQCPRCKTMLVGDDLMPVDDLS